MKNGNAGSTSAAVRRKPVEHSCRTAKAPVRRGGATEDPSAREGNHTSTSNGLFVSSGPGRVRPTRLWMYPRRPGSSTIVARRSRAIRAPANVRSHVLIRGSGKDHPCQTVRRRQSMRFNIQVRESRTIGRCSGTGAQPMRELWHRCEGARELRTRQRCLRSSAFRARPIKEHFRSERNLCSNSLPRISPCLFARPRVMIAIDVGTTNSRVWTHGQPYFSGRTGLVGPRAEFQTDKPRSLQGRQ